MHGREGATATTLGRSRETGRQNPRHGFEKALRREREVAQAARRSGKAGGCWKRKESSAGSGREFSALIRQAWPKTRNHCNRSSAACATFISIWASSA